MAKKKRDSGGGYNFMDTYGDMMTLLLTFFILLFSMSSVDAEKWEILVKAFSRNKNPETSQIVMIPQGDGDNVATVAGDYDLKAKEEPQTDETPTPQDLAELAQMIQQFIEENELEDSMQITQAGENSVYLTFDNNLFFDGDSYVLLQSSYDILSFLGGMFKSLEDQILVIRVNGHTAAIPGMDDYQVNDWDLSAMRATRVATYFEEKTGILNKKLLAIGYGKSRPLASNDTPEGRAANRRVDIQILGNNFDTGNSEELLQILQQTLGVQLFDDSVPEETVTPPDAITDDSSSAQEPVDGSSSGAELEVPVESAPPVSEPVDQAEVDKALDELKREAEKTNS